MIDMDGARVGELPAVELVTVGQRRGLGSPEPGGRRYAVAVDNRSATVTVGPLDALMVGEIPLAQPVWVNGAPGPGEPLLVQMSAHGRPVPGRWAGGTVVVDEPVRRVAPGQSVVLYRDDAVVGGGLVV
jgi:tRNA-uridine 2-sulfurtransferase